MCIRDRASGSPAEVRNILTSAPSRLTIRSSDSKQLANQLIDECKIDSLEFAKNNQLIVTSRQSRTVLEIVTRLAASGQIEVSEIASTDDSLKTLFSTLMKIHRGELEYHPQASS